MDLNSGITEARTSLNSKLEQHPKELSKCTIRRVHEYLRKVNPSAYEPEVVAIGPYHRDRGNLKVMEDYKLHTLRVLDKRRGRPFMEHIVNAVGKLESEARKCYEDFNLSKGQFIEMLVLDGCFIVELVRKIKRASLRVEDDRILFETEIVWRYNSLQRDLMLFENQVPFFFLLELFDLIKDPNEGCRLVDLLSDFFSDVYPGRGHLREVPFHGGQDIIHLLDLVHRNWVPEIPQIAPYRYERKAESQFINCATRLTEANVKFEVFKVKEEATEANVKVEVKEEATEANVKVEVKEEATEANVKFEVKKEATSLFDIKFEGGVMMMAPLRIDDRTECFLRNLIAHEQYFHFSLHKWVTDYTRLLDSLINSSKDVEILSRNRIITNWLGDDEVVANMVNRLRDCIWSSGSCFSYPEIFEDVSDHCKKPWNKWMAKLRRDYLHSPWAIISILAAVLLLLLTVVQTVFTILG